MRLTVAGLKLEMFTGDHDQKINNFLEDESQRLLVVYHDTYSGLHVDSTIPAAYVDQLMYFIKAENVTEINVENFNEVLQYGTVKGRHIESLLRTMMGIYAPIFFENTSWPDSILETHVINHLQIVYAHCTNQHCCVKQSFQIIEFDSITKKVNHNTAFYLISLG